MTINKNWKIVIIILLILLVPGGIVAAIYLLPKNKAKLGIGDSTIAENSTGDTPEISSDFPLRYNPYKKSEKVKTLQRKLNLRIMGLVGPLLPYDEDGQPITELVEDGYFGKKTLTVVKFVFNKEEVTEEMFNSI